MVTVNKTNDPIHWEALRRLAVAGAKPSHLDWQVRYLRAVAAVSAERQGTGPLPNAAAANVLPMRTRPSMSASPPHVEKAIDVLMRAARTQPGRDLTPAQLEALGVIHGLCVDFNYENGPHLTFKRAFFRRDMQSMATAAEEIRNRLAATPNEPEVA